MSVIENKIERKKCRKLEKRGKGLKYVIMSE